MRKLSWGAYLFTRISIAIGVLGILFPLIWIFSLSLKLPEEVFKGYLFIIPKHVTLKNYIAAFDYAVKYFNVSFPKMYLNSFIVTSGTILVSLFISLLAGFALSNYRFRGSTLINSLNFSSFTIPAQVLLIPLYVLLKQVHVLHTYLAVIIPYTLFTVPISVLIFKDFFNQIPSELKEAAKIDGASGFTYFLKIALPITKPAIATCIIFMFTLVWNEFILALVFLGKDQLKTLPVAISTIAGGQYIVPYNIFTASMMICIIPIMFVFFGFQKWFMRGVTAGALKG
ncbi:MAG: carbohydrate ABC transporter permease [Actinobacteria bacterium]|nr:carbohydrate ABC transporter permease [Actinomycetota bacterium]